MPGEKIRAYMEFSEKRKRVEKLVAEGVNQIK